MSASLVGSEMCIRDRHHPAQSCLAQLCAGLFYRKPVRALVVARMIVNPACLLYTSDAADDM
eukprot:4127155-Alexandrium_andersonii.AAC.1